jgi:hypothetical protein
MSLRSCRSFKTTCITLRCVSDQCARQRDRIGRFREVRGRARQSRGQPRNDRQARPSLPDRGAVAAQFVARKQRVE